MLLDEGEFLTHPGHGEGLARLLIVVFATLEEVVPYQPTTACYLSKQTFQFGIGANPKLVAALSDHTFSIRPSAA